MSKIYQSLAYFFDCLRMAIVQIAMNAPPEHYDFLKK